jgi:serine/threonine protein kinase
MGEVWLAEDTELHRQVAAKLLPPVLMQEKGYLRAFAAEARMAASLEHPHILPVHDFGEFMLNDEVITYLIMPVINDGSLRDLIRRRKSRLLPAEVSLVHLRQAAVAIDYAHSKHVLHRDIKPGNMLLQGDWLFLADFGIAKLLTSGTTRSRTNGTVGTPAYMAPEQIKGKAEAASDLYSLAIIAYEMFTGHLPFRAPDPFAIFIKHMREDPPPPRQFNPALPEAMERAILKGMAKWPADRYPSCLVLIDELEQGWQEIHPSARASSGLDDTLIDSWGNYAPAAPTSLASLPSSNTPLPAFSTDSPTSTSTQMDRSLFSRGEALPAAGDPITQSDGLPSAPDGAPSCWEELPRQSLWQEEAWHWPPGSTSPRRARVLAHSS